MTAPVELTWTRVSETQAQARFADHVFLIERIDLQWRNFPAPGQVLFELIIAPFFKHRRRFVCARPDLSEVMATAAHYSGVFQQRVAV